MPRWSGQSIHTIARNADAAGTLPALNALLTSPGFFNFDTNLTYPVAGSFVRYLIDMYGVARMKTLLTGATFNDAATRTQSRYLATYGITVDSAWAEWRRWLRQS